MFPTFLPLFLLSLPFLSLYPYLPRAFFSLLFIFPFSSVFIFFISLSFFFPGFLGASFCSSFAFSFLLRFPSFLPSLLLPSLLLSSNFSSLPLPPRFIFPHANHSLLLPCSLSLPLFSTSITYFFSFLISFFYHLSVFPHANRI